ILHVNTNVCFDVGLRSDGSAAKDDRLWHSVQQNVPMVVVGDVPAGDPSRDLLASKLQCVRTTKIRDCHSAVGLPVFGAGHRADCSGESSEPGVGSQLLDSRPIWWNTWLRERVEYLRPVALACFDEQIIAHSPIPETLNDLWFERRVTR